MCTVLTCGPKRKEQFWGTPQILQVFVTKGRLPVINSASTLATGIAARVLSDSAAAGWWAQPAFLFGDHGFSNAFSLLYVSQFHCCAEDPSINFSGKCCKNKKVMQLPTLFPKVFKWKKVFSIFNKHLQYYWVGFFVHITRLIMLSDTFKACLTKIQWYNGLLCAAFFLHSNHNHR